MSLRIQGHTTSYAGTAVIKEQHHQTTGTFAKAFLDAYGRRRKRQSSPTKRKRKDGTRCKGKKPTESNSRRSSPLIAGRSIYPPVPITGQRIWKGWSHNETTPLLLPLQFIRTTNIIETKRLSTAVLSKTSPVKIVLKMPTSRLRNFVRIFKTVLWIPEHFQLPTCQKPYFNIFDYRTE